MQVAGGVPAEIGAVLATEAREAFTTAFGTSLSVAALIAGVSGLTVFFLGRRDSSNLAADDAGPESVQAGT